MAEFLGLSPYVWIALVSLVFLLIVAAMGGYGLDLGDADTDVDMDYGEFSGPGISPLSLPLIATFGTSFGSMGALLERAQFSPLVVAALAAVGAVIVSSLMYFGVQKFLVRAQGTTEVNPDALVGRDATVLIPIWSGAQGQILVITEERGRTLFPAISEADVPRDAVVEILGFAGGVANVRKKVR